MAITPFQGKAVFSGGHLFQWTGVPNGNQGAGASVGPYSVLTAQASGTFGAAGSVNIEGSMDNVNWSVCHGLGGAAATLTAAGMMAITEVPLYIRPNVTAGDGTTNLTVSILAVGQFV